MRFQGWTIFAAVLAVPACAAADGGPASGIASCMTDAARELGFNGSVYARTGGVVVQRTFGTADADGRVKVTEHTRFSIGSAGKMFTAVAIGRLVDRGQVAFDAPIGRYLSGLEPQFARITVAQLLNHTSGLGDYFVPQNKAAVDAAKTATDLLPLVFAAPPAFAPGSARAYSNSGFAVLGAIIEKVAGMSYADFVQKEILTPLHMTDSRLDAEGGAVPMSRMSMQGMLEKAKPSDLRQLRASPAGGLYSTAADMALFLSALNDKGFLKPDTAAALLQPRAEPNGGSGVYGYGFNVRPAKPLRVGHGGGAPGVNAEIALYPESGSELIALSNYDPPTATKMVGVLEKAMFAADPVSACKSALADPALYMQGGAHP